MTNLTDQIRNHPIVILGSCVIFGITISGAFIVFFMSVFKLDIVQRDSVVPMREVSEKYVSISVHNELVSQLGILLNSDAGQHFRTLLTIREAFRQLLDSMEPKENSTSELGSVYPEVVQTYNFFAIKYNEIFRDSTIPTYDETSPGYRAFMNPLALIATMRMALTVIDGEYLCTTR